MAASETQTEPSERLRQIPSVDELLLRPFLQRLEQSAGRPLLLEVTRDVLETVRRRVIAGHEESISAESLEVEIVRFLELRLAPSLRPVINATGVILHTNLGRAPLAREAIERVAQVAAGYSNLEYDLELGERGKRDVHTDALIARLLGAETVLVVNNNAAAVFLALNTLASDGEVVVSRGELIEIGGSFRIPDICARSGAILREVGTTNRTRLADYASAISERTRVLLRVHPSNFRITGFTERPELGELAPLARQHHLILMEDLGSGCLVDLSPHGLKDEPPVATSLAAGAHLVTFSGDKLLGGPQAGILAGARETLARIRKNPLFRALRVDKLIIAALEGTAQLYLRQDFDAIPALQMIRASAESVALRASRLADHLRPLGFSVRLEEGESIAGGGSTPGQALPTTLVSVTHERCSPEAMAIRLRRNQPPVIVRLGGDQIMLDLRTVLNEADENQIMRAFQKVTEELS
jgi:L-seryl-tRNA(Ser) seleniumtransferase